ncbi:MAG TPA: OmpA family protein [Polyangiaceae bacterium]|nr:OmpA family protein [Polyangiaceae bacterium]
MRCFHSTSPGRSTALSGGLGLAASLALMATATGCTTTIAFEGKTPIAIEGVAPPAKPLEPKKLSRVLLSEKKIEITEKIQFGLDNSTILPESFSLLDEISQVMKDHPEVKKVAIEGHASADGDDNHNLVLSDARAKAVMAYMVTKGGIDPKRLSAEGFGEKKPIADNNTEEGRIKNRRVEFNIVEREATKAEKIRGAK